MRRFRFIPRMRKVSSVPLLSIDTVFSIDIFYKIVIGSYTSEMIEVTKACYNNRQEICSKKM